MKFQEKGVPTFWKQNLKAFTYWISLNLHIQDKSNKCFILWEQMANTSQTKTPAADLFVGVWL